MNKLKLVALAVSAAVMGSTAAQAGDPAPGAHRWPERAARSAHGAVAPHHVRRFEHVRRIDRGGMVPQFWWGPQFVVRNWGMYGFPQPFAGGRWIRYYDDALLIDRYGRVHDGRYGWDWNRGRDRWAYRDGIPEYVGDRDFEPGERDYEWAERWERGDRRDRMARRHGPPPMDCGNPCTRTYHGPPPPLDLHAYGCGCGPVVVTETVTTTAPVVEKVTYYEYEEVRSAPRHKRVIRKAPARRAAPKPGERG